MTTSLYIYAQQVGTAPFVVRTGTAFDDVSGLTDEQRARAIGLQDRGTVEPGMRADLVIWREDPLQEPKAPFGEKTVIRAGRVVDLDT